MCNLLLTGDRFYEIKDGVVYNRSASGDHRDTICWPIAEFRRMLAEGSRVLAEFDAEHRVLMLRG